MLSPHSGTQECISLPSNLHVPLNFVLSAYFPAETILPSPLALSLFPPPLPAPD